MRGTEWDRALTINNLSAKPLREHKCGEHGKGRGQPL